MNNHRLEEIRRELTRVNRSIHEDRCMIDRKMSAADRAWYQVSHDRAVAERDALLAERRAILRAGSETDIELVRIDLEDARARAFIASTPWLRGVNEEEAAYLETLLADVDGAPVPAAA